MNDKIVHPVVHDEVFDFGILCSRLDPYYWHASFFGLLQCRERYLSSEVNVVDDQTQKRRLTSGCVTKTTAVSFGDRRSETDFSAAMPSIVEWF